MVTADGCAPQPRRCAPHLQSIQVPRLQYNLVSLTGEAPPPVTTDGSDTASSPERLDFYLRDVVRSSAAAPTYFPPAQISGLAEPDSRGVTGQDKAFTLVDGGVCCNNPEGAAMAFAMRAAAIKDHVNLRLQDLAVLSIGCGVSNASRKVDEDAGALGWLTSADMVTMFMEAGNDLTTGMVQLLDANTVRSGGGADGLGVRNW